MWVQHLGRAAIEAPHQAVGLGHWVFSHPMVNPQRLVHLVELTRSCVASKQSARELWAVVGEDGALPCALPPVKHWQRQPSCAV